MLYVEKTGRCWLPFWVGDALPERQELLEAGISLYEPHDGVVIGVLAEG